MSEQHAVVTGPITGRIPTPDGAIPHDFVDVTPDVLYFDTEELAVSVAHAIEDEHYVRDTHPVQEQCRELHAQEDISDEEMEAHRALHDEVKARVDERGAAHGKAARR